MFDIRDSVEVHEKGDPTFQIAFEITLNKKLRVTIYLRDYCQIFLQFIGGRQTPSHLAYCRWEYHNLFAPVKGR